MTDFVVVGRGSACAAIIETLGTEEFRGYFDDQQIWKDSLWLGRLNDVGASRHAHFIGLGAIRNMLLRARLIEQLINLDLPNLTAISRGIILSNSAKIGPGTILIGLGSLGTNVVVGLHCLFFSGCVIEHDVQIGDNVNMGPGVVISGKVTIGANVFLGAGSVIGDGVSIGDNSIVGAGSLVLQSIPPGTVAFGRPATPQRPNTLYELPTI